MLATNYLLILNLSKETTLKSFGKDSNKPKAISNTKLDAPKEEFTPLKVCIGNQTIF